MTASETTTMPAHTCPSHGLYFGHSCPSCATVVAPPLELHASPDTDPAGDADSPATETLRAGRYDRAARRTARRTGRERGCWVYIPLEELEKTGMASADALPFYRVWGSTRGSVVVRLYKEK